MSVREKSEYEVLSPFPRRGGHWAVSGEIVGLCEFEAFMLLRTKKIRKKRSEEKGLDGVDK